MKVRGGRVLYIECVHMPTYCSIEGCYKKHKEDVLSFKKKGRVVLLGDFNASL